MFKLIVITKEKILLRNELYDIDLISSNVKLTSTNSINFKDQILEFDYLVIKEKALIDLNDVIMSDKNTIITNYDGVTSEENIFYLPNINLMELFDYLNEINN